MKWWMLLFFMGLNFLVIRADENDNNAVLNRCSHEELKEQLKTVLLNQNSWSKKWLELYKSTDDSVLLETSFLLAYMPERDLKELTPRFIEKNILIGKSVFEKTPWKKQVPQNIYLNYIISYYNVNERRDDWREDFYNRFFPLVENCSTISSAVLELNSKIWDIIDVHYSRKRPKADQSPYESIEAKMASCTGLSILLVDACRSVGIPARFAGVKEWVEVPGNHSWVEIWDGEWKCVGAGEPGPLNETWFMERAAKAVPDNPNHAVYAVSYEQTGTFFPVSWRRNVEAIPAVNVTHRYLSSETTMKPKIGVIVFYRNYSNRIASNIKFFSDGELIAEGVTKDESSDFNDIWDFPVQYGKTYQIEVYYENKNIRREFTIDKPYDVIKILID